MAPRQSPRTLARGQSVSQPQEPGRPARCWPPGRMRGLPGSAAFLHDRPRCAVPFYQVTYLNLLPEIPRDLIVRRVNNDHEGMRELADSLRLHPPDDGGGLVAPAGGKNLGDSRHDDE